MHGYINKLKELRKSKKLTVKELADMIGVCRMTLSAWENGKIVPSEAKLRMLAHKLQIQVNEISDIPPEVPVSDIDFGNAVSRSLVEGAFGEVMHKERVERFYFEIDYFFRELSNTKLIIDALLKAIPAIIYVKNSDYKYVIANDEFYKNAMLKQGINISNKSDYDFFTKKEASENYEEDKQVILTGKGVKKREGFIPGSRKRKWGLLTKMPVFDSDNKITGMVGFIFDITDRKVAEKKVEYFTKASEMIDESIWVAKDLEITDEGIVKRDFIYNIESKLIKKVFRQEGQNITYENAVPYLHSLIIDDKKRVKHDWKKLVENGSSESTYKIKIPSTGEILHLRGKIYYDPGKNIAAGLVQEDYSITKVEEFYSKVMETLKANGADDKIIENIKALRPQDL